MEDAEIDTHAHNPYTVDSAHKLYLSAHYNMDTGILGTTLIDSGENGQDGTISGPSFEAVRFPHFHSEFRVIKIKWEKLKWVCQKGRKVKHTYNV